jgi:hypothetical protein
VGVDKQDLVSALTNSIKELQHGIDTHCCLVKSLVENKVDTDKLQALFDSCPKRSCEIRYEEAIKEAISVIEETRKSFKSKRLEQLRKRLTQVLIEAD